MIGYFINRVQNCCRSVISPVGFISFLEKKTHFPRVWPISLSNKRCCRDLLRRVLDLWQLASHRVALFDLIIFSSFSTSPEPISLNPY